MEQTSAVEQAKRTTADEAAAIYCDSLRRILLTWAPFIEEQEALPAEQRAMLVNDLRDLAGKFETARGDLLGEGKQG